MKPAQMPSLAFHPQILDVPSPIHFLTRPHLLAAVILIAVFACLGLERTPAQASSVDIPAAVASASMANRADSWQATWSAAIAANDGLGVMPDVVWQENGRHDSDGRWRVIRPFLVFPISGLPAGAQVTEASLILRIASIQAPFQSTYDEQTYVQVVRATPQNPNALTAGDFGSAALDTLYSGKHFVQNMAVGTDLAIPLDPAIFGEIADGNTLTLALINGHELENADHWPTVNVHTHFFTVSAPSSATSPLLRVVLGEPLVRTPPYDFADDCTQTSEFGDGVALVSSDVETGTMRVQARATQVGQAISQGGMGITFVPETTGTIRIRTIMRIRGFDILFALGLPDPIGTFAIESIASDIFIEVKKTSGNEEKTDRFRAALITPISGGQLDHQRYDPPRLFDLNLDTSISSGEILKICAGVTVEVKSTSPFRGSASFSAARYDVEVLEIKLIPQ